jgi:hypothetical protein
MVQLEKVFRQKDDEIFLGVLRSVIMLMSLVDYLVLVCNVTSLLPQPSPSGRIEQCHRSVAARTEFLQPLYVEMRIVIFLLALS